LKAYNEKISILDENFTLKEKLLFELGAIKEKISCACVSFNSSTNEELVYHLVSLLFISHI